VKPIKGARSPYARNAVSIADAGGALSRRLGGLVQRFKLSGPLAPPLHTASQWKCGCLDKPEAIYRLPPCGGGAAACYAAKRKSAVMKRVCRVILPQSGEITILRRWTDRKLQSIERRNARPTTIAARGHSLYNSYPLHRRPTNCQIIRSMEENYEEQSTAIHLTRAGADYHRARRIRFHRGCQTSQISWRLLWRGVRQIWPMLPGSVSGGLSDSVSGGLSGPRSCDFVSGPGSCDFVSGSGSCDFVSGSGSCCHVSGSGSCCHVSGSGSCTVVSGSGSGSCHLVSDVSVITLRQDVGYQKCRLNATSNRGENATHILSRRRCRWIAPGVVAGAGLANNLLEIKRLDKPEAINSLSPGG
jgi:hypothetical protein